MSLLNIFDCVVQYKNQDYHKLKKDCLNIGKPFVDSEFPPVYESLFDIENPTPGQNEYVWKRPREIDPSAQLFVERLSSHSVHQGELGNCWFVAACSCITVYKESWMRVIPDYKNQEWKGLEDRNYAGIFRFRFYRFGEWVEVVVDDLLPTKDGQLVFCHSRYANEFWSALLEKAYAKLLGSYAAMEGGELNEVLVDFTGGISEVISIPDMMKSDSDDIYNMLVAEYDNRSLIAVSINGEEDLESGKELESGLLPSHAYSLTMVRLVSLDQSMFKSLMNRNKLRMMRIRNPWGAGNWRGAFGDGSPEWEAVDRSSRSRMGMTFDDDGEFWMTFDDFVKNFHNLVICRQMNTSLISLHKTWCNAEFHGSWQGHLTGGCLNFRDTFLNNPQYLFQIGVDNDEVHIFASQKTSRNARGIETTTGLHHFGFTILKVENNRPYRVHRLDLVSIVCASEFNNSRSVFKRLGLTKGRYVVIPSTFEPGTEADFLLRIFTSKPNMARELVWDIPPTNMCVCRSYPEVVTRITVFKAHGLERVKTIGGADPFCVVECEGEKSYTSVRQRTMNPEWKESFIFYRKRALVEPIKVEIYSKNPVFDDFLGRQTFAQLDRDEGKMIEVDLLGRENKKERSMKRPGRLFVEIFSLKDAEFLKI